jgi:hypothetical protein
MADGWIDEMSSSSILAENSNGTSVTCIGCAELEIELKMTQIELKYANKIVDLLRKEIREIAFKMAPSEKQSGVLKNVKVMDSHSSVAKDAKINRENCSMDRINVDKMELMNLQDDIKELSSSLQTVSALTKEVIQQKNKMLVKMASITEVSMKGEEESSCWTEVKNGRTKLVKKQCDQLLIPVIFSWYELLNNHVEGDEMVFHDRVNLPTYGKKENGSKNSTRNGSKVIIMGDSHARGMATELQHRLSKNFEVLGIVKPGSTLKEITNTINSTVNSLTKNDVCIIWGGSRDVAKNESENGLRHLKDFVTRQYLTNVVVINVPYRHDLQESSCVNSAVEKFNRKLRKYSKALANFHLLEVENCRDLYTNHGLHLNWKGKESMGGKIVNVIKNILNVQNSVPIGMKWKEEERTGSNLPEYCETLKGKNDQCSKGPKDYRQVYSEQGRGLCVPQNQAVLQPKQLRKVPIKKVQIFYGQI